MPHADVPSSSDEPMEPTTRRSTDLLLPGSLRDLAPALALWPALDEPRFRLVCECLGIEDCDWEEFGSTATAAGLALDEPDAGCFRVNQDWSPALEQELARLGGSDALRERLLTCWLRHPDPHVAADMARWARDLEQWTAVELAWIALNQLGAEFPREVLELYRDLPVEARVERPLLSWAIGAATAVLAEPGDQSAATMPHGMLRDAAMLHANWSLREDTDIAVHAGTLRMLGQRRLPAARPGASLEAAWRTKEEVDAFIDARSREGRGPDRRTQAVFRAFSAQLALFRAHPLDAVNEARWAALLADVEPVAILARGVEALALSFSSEEVRQHHSDPPIQRIADPLRHRGMRGLGEAFEILADGNEGVRSLDREQVERSLAMVEPAEAAFGGMWAFRTALEAFHDNYWGDLTEGFDRLTSEVARLSRAGREQDEPMGGAVLNRARTLMLTKSGAFTAAGYLIEALPPGLRLVPQARIHLWAGQFEQAIRVADAGNYEELPGMVDRPMLRLITVAAALLNGSFDAAVAHAAVRDVAKLAAGHDFVVLATLPQSARSAILELCEPELAQNEDYQLMVERLAGLNDAGERGLRPLHLTERERVLLPLLATDDRVPEIARKLQVSVNTVRKQVVTLREKFQAGTRGELIRKARNYGALD